MQVISLPRQAGIYVRSARKQQGLTQKELAQRAGVSERLVLSLELGDAQGIHFDKLLSILSALGMHLFIEETHIPSPSATPEVPKPSKTSDELPPSRELPSNASEEEHPHRAVTTDYEKLYTNLVEAATKGNRP